MSALATLNQPDDCPTLLLHIEKASRALDVSESTLKRLPIPFIRTGTGQSSRRLYAVSDLQAWIDANRQTA